MAWLEYIHKIRLWKRTEPWLHHLDQPSNKGTISLKTFQRHRIQFNSTEMQRNITYGLYSAVKWQYFLSQYHCLHLFTIKMLPYGNVWNSFSGWNSFMVIIPCRLYWKYCSVLCCLAMSDSVACYFQQSFTVCLTPLLADFIFVSFAQTHRKLFSPYSPMKMCFCQQLHSTAALVFILISPREEEWNSQQWHCGVSSCRYCGLTVSLSTFQL